MVCRVSHRAVFDDEMHDFVYSFSALSLVLQPAFYVSQVQDLRLQYFKSTIKDTRWIRISVMMI